MGYHQWRAGLNKFHADTVADMLAKVGYENEFITRIAQAVGKKSLKTNPDTQLLEDLAGLVFLEYYLLDFANRHLEYAESKWIDIIGKSGEKCPLKPINSFLMDMLNYRIPLLR